MIIIRLIMQIVNMTLIFVKVNYVKKSWEYHGNIRSHSEKLCQRFINDVTGLSWISLLLLRGCWFQIDLFDWDTYYLGCSKNKL